MTTPATQPAQDQSPFDPWDAALAAAYAAAVARVRRSVFGFIERAWNLTGSWRDADAARFTRSVVPTVEAAERSISALTSSYLNRVVSEMTGTHRPPVTVSPSEISGSALRAGVDPHVVYQRPYKQVWTDLAADTPLELAVRKGLRRALTTAATDMQLAKTKTAHKQNQRDGRVVGWRRIPQGTYTCALCLIASTLRYTKEVEMAVHPNCDCILEPIHGHFDPGPVLDKAFLDAVHDAIERDLGKDYVARTGRKEDTKKRELDYRDIIVVHEHGEIGPVLGVRRHHFLGPGGVRQLTKFTGPEDIRQFTTHQKIK